MVAANSNPTRGRPRKATPPPADSACAYLLDERSQRLVQRAFKALEKSAVYRLEAISNPGAVRAYLQLRLCGLEHEEFHVLWLDAQNRIISFDAMFSGALTQTAVYPREVVKAGLAHNAAAAILAHNHPSGVARQSQADELLTQNLKNVLALVDIKLLDHFIVAGNAPPLSFAECGLL